MQVEQRRWSARAGWESRHQYTLSGTPQLVLAFGATGVLEDPSRLDEVRSRYPEALLFGCSTAGEISGTQVTDGTLVTTAIHFEHTRLSTAQVEVGQPSKSAEAGAKLARALGGPELVHVLVLSDGLHVNGSELVTGLSSALPAGVAVTGGLSGDGARFGKTLVLTASGPKERTVVAVGLHGSRLKLGYASLGGWDPFGPERRITRASGNVLYEVDGTSALALYKKYLGEAAQALPSSALRFPLSLRDPAGGAALVRTVLGIDEQAQSMTFAGNVPVGWYAQLMKANFERLVDGAIGAARTSQESIRGTCPELALLISCVGRKLVLTQRIEEEVEGVREVVGERPALSGFYSYGEISPFSAGARCELHNQTMTITTLAEV